MTDTKELIERLREMAVNRPFLSAEDDRLLTKAADALEAAEARAERAEKDAAELRALLDRPAVKEFMPSLQTPMEAGMTDRQPQQCAENAHCSPADLSLQKVQESPEPVVRPGGGDG